MWQNWALEPGTSAHMCDQYTAVADHWSDMGSIFTMARHDDLGKSTYV